ncbi:mobilization protein [Lampropedia puyangensis]|uniref:Mobilization protein n=1 Tax=Lampropedia puyangensis TaxID=1330072 RepID=A0A4S8FBW5_9BURK|nr:mobilization protein [Lampropedia puyangensis]THU05133.1 mobilization protein [Lampropedia puyangensis]
MSGIHFIGGEKGGVGKSVVARILAQYMIDKAIPFRAFDSDKSHGALLRYYADYASPVVLDVYENVDAVLETVAQEPEQRVLVDLAAQTYDQLWKWFADSAVVDVAQELGIDLHYWHVMDAGADSVRLLEQLLNENESGIKLVVVLNDIRGDKFELFEKSGLRERAIGRGAQFVHLRRLPDVTMRKIDDNGSSFWSAINNTEGHALGLLERQRVKVWINRMYCELDQIEV